MRQTWEKEHNVFYHENCPPIKLEPTKLFKTKLCFDHSLCVCGGHDASFPDALAFQKKLIARMKMIFTKTKKQISEPRLLLEAGKIILKFLALLPGGEDGVASDCAMDEPECIKEVFCMVGYTNFQSWNFSVIELDKVCDCNENGYLQLVPTAIDRPCSDHGVKTALHFAAYCLDLSLVQKVMVLKLVEDDAPLSAEHMLGSCVEVGPLKGALPFTVWEGSDREKQLRTRDKSDKPHHGPRPKGPKPFESGASKPPAKRQKSVAVADHAQIEDGMFSSALDDGGNDTEVSENPVSELESVVAADDDADSGIGFDSDKSEAWPEPSEHSNSDFDFMDEPDLDLDNVYLKYPDSPVPVLAASQDQNDSVAEQPNNPPSASSSSSGSSDSSSSSSSSSEARSTAGVQGPRRAPVTEYKIDVGEHSLQFNITGQYFRAHCAQHEACRRQRTACASTMGGRYNSGQGRPIGLLVDWLERADMFASKADHMKDRARSQDHRSAARQRFKALSGSDTFLREEREQDDDEYSEPDEIV